MTAGSICGTGTRPLRRPSGMPGTVFENLIILGSHRRRLWIAPGWLRAFDVITGKQVWTFQLCRFPANSAMTRGLPTPINMSAA